MHKSIHHKIFENILSSMDVRINGSRAWDIAVHNERMFQRVLTHGSIGLGTSYMDGWWDCAALDELAFRAANSGFLSTGKTLIHFAQNAFSRCAQVAGNIQSPARSRLVAKVHYDLDTSLFQAMLDPFMQYSCAYFEGTENLARAQENKLNLITQKLELASSDTLLDIGCGWGGLAKHIAHNIGCEVTGVNISEKQLEFGREFCSNLPVTLVNQDYRCISGTFDKVVSVGMFEHVGTQNYRLFMLAAARALKPEGIFLLHTIVKNHSDHICDPWIKKHIFPNSHIPSIAQIGKASEDIFVVEDVHNLGPHYDKTLMAWHANFENGWPRLAEKFDEQFRRMWNYYLLTCAGTFRARDMQCCQIVFSKKRVKQPSRFG